MQLLDSLTLHKGAQQRTIERWHGDLLAYMDSVQYTDCREFDQAKLRQALEQLVNELN